MKKYAILFTALLMTVSFLITPAAAQAGEPCKGKQFSLTVGAGMRSVKDDLYKDVYEDAGMTYYIDLGVKLFKSFEVFVHTDVFSKDGLTTFTMEDTTLKMFPIELGVRFVAEGKNPCKSKFVPYIGAGAGYYNYKEENVIDDINENKLGFFAEGGIRFYVISSVFIDAKGKYIFLKVDDTELGGFSYMGGIGISF